MGVICLGMATIANETNKEERMRYSVEGTQYYGIYLIQEGDTWWIQDHSGCDKCFGTTKPTEADVTKYRNRVAKRFGR